MTERMLSAQFDEEDDKQEYSLRPRFLREFIGQKKLKENLALFIEAAKGREEPLDHVLLYGPPGLGKTTVAHIIANEMQAGLRSSAGPAIERPGDLVAILTNLEDRSVLFIDEIHRLSRVAEEILYPAMEDFHVDVIIGAGPAARSIKIEVPRFTLVGATTRAGLLSSPLRDRFGIVLNFDFYEPEDLQHIVLRSADILQAPIDPNGALEIARRSRGTPRIANRLLKRVRDYAQVKADGSITAQVADEALLMLEVDELGLDETDRRFLRVLIEKYDGGPAGLGALAATLNVEVDTIEDVYEPFLLKEGFIRRTSRGREATDTAYEHLGIRKTHRRQAHVEEEPVVTAEPSHREHAASHATSGSQRAAQFAYALSALPQRLWYAVVESEPEWVWMKPFYKREPFGKFATFFAMLGLNDFETKSSAETGYWPVISRTIGSKQLPTRPDDLIPLLRDFYLNERHPQEKISRLQTFCSSSLAADMWSISAGDLALQFDDVWVRLAETIGQKKPAAGDATAMICLALALLMAGRTDISFDAIPVPTDPRLRALAGRLEPEPMTDAAVRHLCADMLRRVQAELPKLTLVHLDSLLLQIGMLDRHGILNYLVSLGADRSSAQQIASLLDEVEPQAGLGENSEDQALELEG